MVFGTVPWFTGYASSPPVAAFAPWLPWCAHGSGVHTEIQPQCSSLDGFAAVLPLVFHCHSHPQRVLATIHEWRQAAGLALWQRELTPLWWPQHHVMWDSLHQLSTFDACLQDPLVNEAQPASDS